MQHPIRVLGRFPQMHTTFRPFGPSDEQPVEAKTASDQGWYLINGGCQNNTLNPAFAGNRMVQPNVVVGGKKQSNMIIIFDADGYMAGKQSLVPPEHFSWDCTYNDYYVKEQIQMDDGFREYCVSTMYFRDPATICTPSMEDAENHLFMQRKDSYAPANLDSLPTTWEGAEKNQDFWALDRYIPAMGHHTTPNLHDSEDCKSYMPLQVLYAYIDGHCRNSGFVWSHWGSDVADQSEVRPHGDQWEHTTVFVIKAILTKPSQCEIDEGAKGTIRTQHVYLGGSTTYCWTE